jgi:hypothetical protein
MNRIALSAVTGILVLAGPVACGSDPTGSDGDGTGNGTLTALIGGVSFSGSLAASATYQSGSLSIAAVDHGNSRVLVITLSHVGGPGTYALGWGQSGIAQYFESDGVTSEKGWATSIQGATGTVMVTELSATGVKGTFAFTLQPLSSTSATGSKGVTNGSFNLKLE